MEFKYGRFFIAQRKEVRNMSPEIRIIGNQVNNLIDRAHQSGFTVGNTEGSQKALEELRHQLYINPETGKLIADVPDKTGIHLALDGSPLYIDVDGIETRNNRQVLIVAGPAVGGVRVIGLTQEGKGSTDLLRKGGDGKQPSIAAVLHERPIRISYQDRKRSENRSLSPAPGGRNTYIVEKRTYYNPRWSTR